MKYLCLFLCLLCYTVGYTQTKNNEDRLLKLYANQSGNFIKPDKKYLVKVKHPSRFLYNNTVIRRLSQNLFIVSDIDSKVIDKTELLSSQEANDLWKASDNLVDIISKRKTGKITVSLTLSDKSRINFPKEYGKMLSYKGDYIVIQTDLRQLTHLLADENVLFVDLVRKAKEEIIVNDGDLSTNAINELHGLYPFINGDNINISIKENKFDPLDLDLLGKNLIVGNESSLASSHATIMGTLMAGRGNSFIRGLGVAPKAKLASSNFADLSPDSLKIFNKHHIFLQNHSYGTAIENYYGNEALQYDEQVYQADSIIHVFSAGNLGTSSASVGLYTGIPNFANITGNFKQAKNIIVVGGTNRSNIPQALSSSGPAYDGRVKPELLANGEDGTSGAAALTTGVIALLQQTYYKTFNKYPSSALVKSILVNTADKIDSSEISYRAGFGKLNGSNAIKAILNKSFFIDQIKETELREHEVILPAGVSKFKVTLSWIDPPAKLNAVNALVNDLDIIVKDPSNTVMLPWTLNSYPSSDSLSQAPHRSRDSLNNIEQVTMDNPPAGRYVITVKGTKVSNVSQQYFVAYSYNISNKFNFINPGPNEQFISQQENYIRWESTFDDTKGNLSVSYDGGSSWLLLSEVQISKKYFDWVCPTFFTRALLKMDIGNQSFISPPFVVSLPMVPKVGFNCGDQLLLYWPKVQNATGYNIYNLNKDSLQLLKQITDTTVLLKKTEINSDYFAVSATAIGFESVKSPTINISNQGVGCYVKSLLADVIANQQVQLILNLGSSLNLNRIVWQKEIDHNRFVDFGILQTNGGQTQYTYIDPSPKTGIQYYKAFLITNDGEKIESNLTRAVILKKNQFLTYPDPCADFLNVLNGSDQDFEMSIYTISGKELMSVNLSGRLVTTSVAKLNAGTYIAVIKSGGKILYTQKLIKI